MGVNRYLRYRAESQAHSCPHTRGGEPILGGYDMVRNAGCPHTRGGEPLIRRVAEIRGWRCPHTRGGEPGNIVARFGQISSCPHTRGGEPVVANTDKTVLTQLSPHPWG